MIKLIKSELKKIFHKKSFYIVTILFILYAVLTNVIYKDIDNMEIVEESTSTELAHRNKELDLNNKEQLEEYVSNTSIIEIEELKEKYPNKEYMIETFLGDIIRAKNESKYISKDEAVETKLTNEISVIQEKIKDNDYKYFVSLKIDELNELLNTTSDLEVKTRINEYLRLNRYRLNNNVPYEDDNYLHEAIVAIETNLVEYNNLKKINNKTAEEQKRFDYLKEESLINNYVLDTGKDVNSNSNLRTVLKNFTSEFSLFIIIFIVMISGSIVSEEYNKGTIKYLLIKPYKRSTILLSKLLTVLILIPFIILFMALIETIIGGIMLGFDSLANPILIYNIKEGVLISYNPFTYLLLSLLVSCPIYLVLTILCFSLSTITASTSAAITITFLFYLASNIISNLALTYNMKILKAFVSVHWDFTYLLNHTVNPYHIRTLTSLVVVSLYVFVILCITFIYFRKKDVKNI